ncbi:uncharacterized protein LOC128986172 isoform X1 [Macrosteles quadrilineatus]|uniref:uncharacterized protein LOC128986172 isoform X1 n=1 Tax=Macrosteles quadrilineatus TaxID=74068 RepID=UPI0023E0A45A|nr:uncharacterized protein LOC128986172 isoform X1 [Macrosteles quadrilineatus]
MNPTGDAADLKMSSKRSADEPMQNDEKKIKGDSENEASNDIKENVASNDIEENVASNDIEENVASNDIKENVASNDIEENVASNDIEENVASNDIEENVASNDIEENVASNDIEENVASNDIEENVASNDIEENVASNDIEENEASNDNEETEPASINIDYYAPEWIFCNEEYTDKDGKTRNNNPDGMAAKNHFDLVKAFYHSRHPREEIQGTYYEMNNYFRNAGALQLYKKDGITKYTIPGKERKEYNTISCTVSRWKCSLGHTERILMRDVLDDLIEADSGKSGIPPRPSDYKDDDKLHEDDYKILNNLTKKASDYKLYLNNKGLIVKMWSERRPCDWNDCIGDDCSTFIRNICPEGSQCCYIVEGNDPTPENVKSARHAFDRLFIDYIADLMKSQENVKFQFYQPNTIFSSQNEPKYMAGPRNIRLASSFYYSRYDVKGRIRPYGGNYSLNAGAVRLYKEDGLTQEGIAHNILSRECVCEELMTMVLKDLSDESIYNAQTSEKSADNKIKTLIKCLKSDPIKCKQYLEEKGLIVKMWCERLRVCCVELLIDICPAGSQIGYIVDDHFDHVKDYNQVKDAFETFRLAFEENCKSSLD